MKYSVKLAIVFCFAAAFILAILFSVFARSKQSQNTSQKPKPSVNAQMVKTVRWQPLIKATGTLVSVNGISLKSQATGTVKKILFTSGKNVKQGQLLVELDNSSETAALKDASSQLELDKLNYLRYSALAKTGAVSKSDYDNTKYTYLSSVAKAQVAQSALNKTFIYAPFSGKIGLSNISLGEYLTIGTPVADLVQVNPIWLDFEIPQKYLSKIIVGQLIKARVDSYANKKFTGKVIAINTVIDNATGNVKVRAQLSNQQDLLMSGNTADVALYIGKPKLVMTVAQTAIQYSDTQTYVYRVVGNKAVKTSVKLGSQIGQSIQIVSGLTNKDEIVTVGGDKLHDGSIVNVEKSTNVNN